MKRLLLIPLALVLMAVSPIAKTIYPATAVTADVNSDAVCMYTGAFPGAESLIFQETATFVSGTPTLDVKMQHSADGVTNWIDIPGASFTQVTTASAYHTLVPSIQQEYLPCIRAVIDVGGSSPSYVVTIKVNYRNSPINP